MKDNITTDALRRICDQIQLPDINAIAREAGRRILSIYERDFSVAYKADKTPVTEADELANTLIQNRLKSLSSLPVLSEEGHLTRWEDRQCWSTYWLIDPLDGTKEFVNRNDDFTVNIALVHRHQAVLGFVYAPVTGESWWSVRGEGSWYQPAGHQAPITRLQVAPLPEDTEQWVELGSRSYESPSSRRFSNALGPHHKVAVGSSLKMCRIAAGDGHLYARLGPTSEWDTAAAQVILEEAGGVLVHAETLKPLRYNTRKKLLNPWFVAASGHDRRWHHALNKILHDQAGPPD